MFEFPMISLYVWYSHTVSYSEHEGLSCDLMRFVHCINIPRGSVKYIYGNFAPVLQLMQRRQSHSCNTYIFR